MSYRYNTNRTNGDYFIECQAQVTNRTKPSCILALVGPIGFGLSSFSSIASSAVLKPGDNGYQSWNTTFMDIGVGGVALKIGGWYGATISIGYWGLKYGATHMSPTQIRQLPVPQPFIFGGH